MLHHTHTHTWCGTQVQQGLAVLQEAILAVQLDELERGTGAESARQQGSEQGARCVARGEQWEERWGGAAVGVAQYVPVLHRTCQTVAAAAGCCCCRQNCCCRGCCMVRLLVSEFMIVAGMHARLCMAHSPLLLCEVIVLVKPVLSLGLLDHGGGLLPCV